MSTKRAHVVLPESLVKEIDRIAGSRGRSAFLADLARREIKRRHLLKILKSGQPVWKDEDHPELKQGAAEWVRKMRRESEARFERLDEKRKRN
ncbi:MAG TPA: hypothetical protein VEV17_18140 [Bryobacteraceae bacterium]|nr:hypothetical protein [Bryobacteraceae bacterium]